MGLLLSSFALACQPSEVVLPLPELDPSWRSALLFLQTGSELSSSVQSARAFSLEVPELARVEVEEARALRLLTYAESLDELLVAPGAMSRPPAGGGRALDLPSAAFVATVASEMSWQDEVLNSIEALPWELPAPPSRNRCEELRFSSWSFPELVLIQPRTLVALSPNHVVVGGFRSGIDIAEVSESFLASIRDLGGRDEFTPLGAAWPRETVRSIVADDADHVLGVTLEGRVFRAEISTASVSESATRLPADRTWTISRGADGFVVIFDGTVTRAGAPIEETLDAFTLDPSTLELAPFEAPEPFSEVEVVSADLIWASAKGRIYSFDGISWRRDYEVEGGSWVTDFAVDDSGTRVVAVVAETFLIERSSAGEWFSLPAIRGSFGVNEALFLSTGEIVTGGATGFYSVYTDDEWCQPESRPFSRDLRALHRAPGTDFVLTVTYSEHPSEPLLVARMEFPPPAD